MPIVNVSNPSPNTKPEQPTTPANAGPSSSVPDVKLIDIDKIKIQPGRGRKDFGNLLELRDSINNPEIGLLTALAVKPMDNGTGEYWLVAGERRLRAILMLGWRQVPCIIKQGKAAVGSEASELYSKIGELEENLQRKEMDWPEKSELMRQIDEARRKLHGSGGQGQKEGWTTSKTAAEVGMDVSYVSKNINMAELLKSRPDLKAQLENLPFNTAVKVAKSVLEAETISTAIAKGEVTTTQDLVLGNTLDLTKNIVSESVDLLLTDPPFGMDEIEQAVGTTRGSNMAYTAFLASTDNSSIKEVRELLVGLIPEWYRVLKPSSHVYIFCSMELYFWLREQMVTAGFEINIQPLLWHKGKMTSVSSNMEYGSSYEVILYGHKPPRSKNLLRQTKNILDFAPLHDTKKVHRFQKPPDLLEFLITQSSKPGDVVMDNFAGSGATLLMAKQLDRSSIGHEIDTANWARAQGFLAKGFDLLNDLNAEKKDKSEPTK